MSSYDLTITLPKLTDAMDTPLAIVINNRDAGEWIEEYAGIRGVAVLTRAYFQELAAELNDNGFRVDYARPTF